MVIHKVTTSHRKLKPIENIERHLLHPPIVFYNITLIDSTSLTITILIKGQEITIQKNHIKIYTSATIFASTSVIDFEISYNLALTYYIADPSVSY